MLSVFGPRNGQIVFRQFDFLMTNIFCNIFCPAYFFEMDEARRLRK